MTRRDDITLALLLVAVTAGLWTDALFTNQPLALVAAISASLPAAVAVSRLLALWARMTAAEQQVADAVRVAEQYQRRWQWEVAAGKRQTALLQRQTQTAFPSPTPHTPRSR